MKEKKATTKNVTVENANEEKVKEEKAKEVKAEAKKPEKKASEKKAAKKTTTGKKDAKKTEKKTNSKIDTKVLFQYSGNEIDPESLLDQAKVQYVAAGGAEKDIKKIELYIKPEDNAAYYVVNGVPAGKVVIFA